MGIITHRTQKVNQKKALKAAAESMKMTPVCDPLEILGVAEASKLSHAAAFAEAYLAAYHQQ